MAQSDLTRLVQAARSVKMTAADRERQRRSFAYGNTHAENEKITRTTIDNAAERLTNGGSKD